MHAIAAPVKCLLFVVVDSLLIIADRCVHSLQLVITCLLLPHHYQL